MVSFTYVKTFVTAFSTSVVMKIHNFSSVEVNALKNPELSMPFRMYLTNYQASSTHGIAANVMPDGTVARIHLVYELDDDGLFQATGCLDAEIIFGSAKAGSSETTTHTYAEDLIVIVDLGPAFAKMPKANADFIYNLTLFFPNIVQWTTLPEGWYVRHLWLQIVGGPQRIEASSFRATP